MNNQSETLERVGTHLTASVNLFGELMHVDEQAVPVLMRNQALLRRLRVSFLALYEYVREKTQMPETMHDKPLEEIADYFVTQKCLSEDDKKPFLVLGSIYTAIRWSAPGTGPHAEKIMSEVPAVYDFLQRYCQSLTAT